MSAETQIAIHVTCIVVQVLCGAYWWHQLRVRPTFFAGLGMGWAMAFIIFSSLALVALTRGT